HAELFELDMLNGGKLKINPLVSWSSEGVWEHIRAFDVPYNVLHDEGFPSIGCAPCTRAIEPGEDERAGRWWWERPEGRECGLHHDSTKAREEVSP
ncbi:MAG: phosphoadenosine phosphosulfate reductase family protein, partial [Myxococcota bacterium]